MIQRFIFSSSFKLAQARIVLRSFFETKYDLLQSFFLIEELLLNESFLLVNSIFMLKGKSDTKINKLSPEITECFKPSIYE